MIPQMLLKLLLPKAADYVAKIIKLDKVLKNVEETNALDVQIIDIEKKTTDIAFKVTAMQDVLKSLGEDQHPPAIDLDEWEQMKADMKKIRNKGAFKKIG